MHLSQFSKMYYKNIDWRRDKSCPYLVRFISTSICCGALRVHRVNLKKKVLTVHAHVHLQHDVPNLQL